MTAGYTVTEPAAADPPAAWPEAGPLDGRAAFQAAVRGLVVQAAAQGIRRMWWVSPDWVGWPLDEPALLDALTAWARRSSVELVWLSTDFDGLRSGMPRLLRWRQTWAHRLRCMGPTELAASDMRSLLIADDRLLIQWTDPSHGRGRVSGDPRDIRQAHEWIDAVLQRSTETLPVTTLGI